MPRSVAISKTFAAMSRSSPVTISDPQCVMIARGALDFIERRRVFQRRRITESFAEISGSNDAPHDFGISRFGNVADEQNFLGSERFAKLGGERVF
jgi:hypothetical protein